ncbi:hypothetical protein I5907_18110 [Panacibacter sp. DH6]|uniref:Uncharacterized protein n=1 Tax=Panacibacter microcysteis TaxID=2793269 RepID=A0A931MD31_9BACT|nr:hypothetical protein [Panacibacter microcysteis]MBG9378158.1 hypothetical protein [Panacibacter microcysteis]
MILLSFIAVYFPFSLKGYQPLCFEVRHFLFLLPFGVAASTFFIERYWSNEESSWMLVIASALLFICGINISGEKWYWMMYGLLFFFFFVQRLLLHKKFFHKAKYLAFATVLLIYMPYHLFYKNGTWYKDMQQLSKKIDGQYFYFPEHDNMQYWKLLHGFNDIVHSFNLDNKPFKVFPQYYEKLDEENFQPGWFVVNNRYTIRSVNFLNTVKVLSKNGFIKDAVDYGEVSAYLIDSFESIKYISKAIEKDNATISKPF